MTYLEQWNEKIEQPGINGQYSEYAQEYYKLEQDAYREILASYPNREWKDSAKTMAENLGFSDKMDIFVGFLEGINSSLNSSIDLASVDDATEIVLDIDYAKLHWNMHDASAKWLYELDEWTNVFSKDELLTMTKNYRREHIAVSNKVGRNDPCTCGSGKKYKQCCGKKG